MLSNYDNKLDAFMNNLKIKFSHLYDLPIHQNCPKKATFNAHFRLPNEQIFDRVTNDFIV